MEKLKERIKTNLQENICITRLFNIHTKVKLLKFLQKI